MLYGCLKELHIQPNINIILNLQLHFIILSRPDIKTYYYRALRMRGNLTTLQVGWLLIQPYSSYLPLAPVGQFQKKYNEVVFRTITKIPALILWLEPICFSGTRNQKVK
jgi:hypothetical protein